MSKEKVCVWTEPDAWDVEWDRTCKVYLDVDDVMRAQEGDPWEYCPQCGGRIQWVPPADEERER